MNSDVPATSAMASTQTTPATRCHISLLRRYSATGPTTTAKTAAATCSVMIGPASISTSIIMQHLCLWSKYAICMPARVCAQQTKLANQRDTVVNTTTPASALRELRAHYRQPMVLAVMAGVALILGISGPFHTLSAFPLLPRLGYWTAVVVLTYGAGYFISRLAGPRFVSLPLPLRVAATAFLIACAVTVIILILNLGMGVPPETIAESTGGFLAIFGICLAVEAVGAVARLTFSKATRPAVILDRLPFDKRGALIALSAQDHYVDVITTSGREMLLMRLSDAIRETGDVPGLQVHRSHWVARAHITRVRRNGDTATLTLRDHTEIPVSRSGLKLVQDAGLLPARGARGD
jgi:LytTr DNA-binding domain